MIRGTTPTITIDTDEDLSDGWDVYITFDWKTDQITKSGSDLEITSSSVVVTLSQEETLKFPEGNQVKVQLRAVDGEGVAIASEVGRIVAEEVLLEEVIPIGSENED